MSRIDPPEYAFQSQAEKIFDRGLYGIYDVDEATGKIVDYWRIPDDYGSKEQMQELYDSIIEDWPERADTLTIEELSWDACCDMAESEHEDALESYYDYKYHAEKESQPSDYDDYY
jgi:hypothetical protein